MDRVLRLFKALADESRLRIIGLLATQQERSVDELAATLDLKPPTVSHHLARLKDTALVTMRKDGNSHFYALQTDILTQLSKEVLSLPKHAEPHSDAWDRKVLSDFLTGDRLKEIPASRKKRQVILHWLASKFDKQRRYKETEVNDLLQQHHPDSATLRRELVGAGLLERQDSIYWRTTQ
jgi:DNA-binding transcriptional ArsR family regulator